MSWVVLGRRISFKTIFLCLRSCSSHQKHAGERFLDRGEEDGWWTGGEGKGWKIGWMERGQRERERKRGRERQVQSFKRAPAGPSSPFQWSPERLKLTGGECLRLCLGCGWPASTSVDSDTKHQVDGQQRVVAVRTLVTTLLVVVVDHSQPATHTSPSRNQNLSSVQTSELKLYY